MNIGELIEDKPLITNSLINKWYSYLDNIDETKLTDYYPTVDVLNRCSFNFYGLLKELNIPSEFFYPHLVLNGLKASTDFNIDKTNGVIKIINSEYIDGIYNNILVEIKNEKK